MLNHKGDEQMKRFSKVSLITLLAVTMSFGLIGSVRAGTHVNLGTADRFAILSGAGITDTGFLPPVPGPPAPGGSSIAAGDVGASPITGAAIELYVSQMVTGSIFSVDAFAQAGSIMDPAMLIIAKNDLTTAYNFAAAQPTTMNLTGQDLGGMTLAPGVYTFDVAAQLTGTLTLDPGADPDPVWIFQTGTTLVTAPNASVVLLGIANPCDVFWQVGSSATIGTGTTMVGNIMADQAIALQTGATLRGSAQARIASVTLDNNVITKNPCVLRTITTPGSETPGTTMPYTGIEEGNMSPWNMIAIVGFSIFGLICGLFLFKSTRTKKETS